MTIRFELENITDWYSATHVLSREKYSDTPLGIGQSIHESLAWDGKWPIYMNVPQGRYLP
ncbi:hypothetical protein AB0E67_17225 [Streptomyces sp. NPDC032161]|uniref:hypothetical protein n=1 Tax=unclassified Streptomyces TaxID=2593676 RepID=UPI0033F06581